MKKFILIFLCSFIGTISIYSQEIDATDTIENASEISEDYDPSFELPDPLNGLESTNATLNKRQELRLKLSKLGLLDPFVEVKIGTFTQLNTLKKFFIKFPCLKNEDITDIMTFGENGEKTIHQYSLRKWFKINEALDKLNSLKCLSKSDPPFLKVLQVEDNYNIFYTKNGEKESFLIKKNGEVIWQSE